MGRMVNGRWMTEEDLADLNNAQGEFVRTESRYRNFIEPTAGAVHPAEAGRYHVFLAHS